MSVAVFLDKIATLLFQLMKKLECQTMLGGADVETRLHQILTIHLLLISCFQILWRHINHKFDRRPALSRAVNAAEMHFILYEIRMPRVHIERYVGALPLVEMQPVFALSLRIRLHEFDYDEVVCPNYLLMQL